MSGLFFESDVANYGMTAAIVICVIGFIAEVYTNWPNKGTRK